MEKFRILALVAALVSGAAVAHPQGFHVKMTFTVTPKVVTGLLVMDIDAGDRCLLLRTAADSNRNGVLEPVEVKQLDRTLSGILTKNLKLGVSGAKLAVEVKETRLSTREDVRANDSGLSVAVLVEVTHAHPVPAGVRFEVENVSPDLSAMRVEVLQAGEPVHVADVESGQVHSVRLTGR